MVIQNTVTNQIVEVAAGTGNILAKGTTTATLKAQPEIDNDGLMGSVTSGSFGSVWGPGLNTIVFKNDEVLVGEMEFATETVRNTALTNLLGALGDGVAACSVNPTTGAVVDLATP